MMTMNDADLIDLLKRALDSTGHYVHERCEADGRGPFLASDEYLGMELTPAEAEVLRPIVNLDA